MFGEHEAAGAIPVIPTKKWFSFRTVRNPDSVLFMPSLRGTRHDSAKIDGGGSNPPGGTSVGRRSSVPDHPVDTSDPERDTTLRASQFVCMLFYGPLVLGYRLRTSSGASRGAPNPSSALRPFLRRGLVTRLDSKSDRAGFNS